MNNAHTFATTVGAILLALASTAHAAKETPAADATAKAPGRQQTKMAVCNKSAGEKTLKGAERKKFMSECLSAKKSS